MTIRRSLAAANAARYEPDLASSLTNWSNHLSAASRGAEVVGTSGVPLLSEIPYLGNLFKTTSDSTVRTELLVLITPRVVRDQSEAVAVTDELRKRLRALSPLERKIR